ncbi:MAG: hypothetical protein E7I45_07520 [Eikenella corrodens]|uniref:hypothetical protein n=1 Tax=Eikenella corrodens TaxID=539 RepID=UPI00291341B6|nr:hypothetical protein [Eikenella corrodens]MDU4300802.1 hypothetical protein [Eikenella corrodens]
MAKTQYSKKLRRLLARLHKINRRITEAYQAAPDEIVSTPFDCAASAANPASPTLPQSPVAALQEQGSKALAKSSVVPQSAEQSESEQPLYPRYIRLKHFAARQQLAILEHQFLIRQQMLSGLTAQGRSLIRRRSISDSFLRSGYFNQWLKKYDELITELDTLLEGITDDA